MRKIMGLLTLWGVVSHPGIGSELIDFGSRMIQQVGQLPQLQVGQRYVIRQGPPPAGANVQEVASWYYRDGITGLYFAKRR